MKRFLPLLLCILFTGPAPARKQDVFLDTITKFDRAAATAKSWKNLYPQMSSDSVKAFKGLKNEKREHMFRLLKINSERASANGYRYQVEEKQVQGDRAIVVFTIFEQSGGGKEVRSGTRKTRFHRENGRWKIHLEPIL